MCDEIFDCNCLEHSHNVPIMILYPFYTVPLPILLGHTKKRYQHETPPVKFRVCILSRFTYFRVCCYTCRSRSVKGTYYHPNKRSDPHPNGKRRNPTMTPISSFSVTLPWASLSTWIIRWLCVPTGMNILPGLASWSTRSFGRVGAAAPTWIASYGPTNIIYCDWMDVQDDLPPLA